MCQAKDIIYDLRASNILCQPKFINKITYSKKTFSYYGTHIWNSLSNNIKQCTRLDKFKTLKKIYIYFTRSHEVHLFKGSVDVIIFRLRSNMTLL